MHVLQSRRSSAFSVALTTVSLRRSLVRAYISKPVVTAPPLRYLSHASGADFYRRGDSRGKFIKSPSPPFLRTHQALSRGLEGRGCFSSYFYLTSYSYQWRKRRVFARFRNLSHRDDRKSRCAKPSEKTASTPLQEGHTLGTLHSIHAHTERYNCIFEFNSEDPTALHLF